MKNSDLPAMPVYLDSSCWKLRWKMDVGTAKAGEEAGSEVGRGYRQVKFKGKRYLAHRVIFYLAYGWLPEIVDHIDGDASNNNPGNLRAATHSQNMSNRKLQSNNRVGRTGIDFMPRQQQWRAQIHKDGKKIYLGMHRTLVDAVAERMRAEREYHGEYTRN